MVLDELPLSRAEVVEDGDPVRIDELIDEVATYEARPARHQDGSILYQLGSPQLGSERGEFYGVGRRGRGGPCSPYISLEIPFVTDGARQYLDVSNRHAKCRIHEIRRYKKLMPFLDQLMPFLDHHRSLLDKVMDQIWGLFDLLNRSVVPH